MFPPEPMRALTLPRRLWTLMLACAPSALRLSTRFPPAPTRFRGQTEAVAAMPADMRKRRREKRFGCWIVMGQFQEAGLGVGGQPGRGRPSHCAWGRFRKPLGYF